MAIFLQLRLREAATRSATFAFNEQIRLRNAGTFERNPEAEQLILKHWPTAYRYCREVLRKPWPGFEAAMATAPPTMNQDNARAAFNYARYVANSRIEQIEKHIAPDAMAALDYAKEVLCRPWVKEDSQYETATKAIQNHPTALRAYHTEMNAADMSEPSRLRIRF